MTTDTRTALSIRDIEKSTADRFRRGAAARGITQAEFMDRLMDLHEMAMRVAAREPAQGGSVTQLLARCELTRVAV